MRTVGIGFGPLGRVAWILLETVGQAGDAVEGDPALEDAPSAARVRDGLAVSARAPGVSLESAASFDCSCCQTATVES